MSLPGLCSVWPERLAEPPELWLRLCQSRTASVPSWELADGGGMCGTLLKWCHWSKGCCELQFAINERSLGFITGTVCRRTWNYSFCL